MYELGVGHQFFKDLEQGIDNRLAKGIGGLRELFVGHVACGKGKVATLVRDNDSGSLNRPLREISPVLDCHGLVGSIVGHLRFLWVVAL
jgi:hypothetical protein